MVNKVSRGIRNNNPLNIRRNPRNRWKGLCQVQEDRAFCQFTEMKWGLRAAMKLMDNYVRQGCQTPRQIITRWAPPAENDTKGYVRQACQRAGLDPDAPVIIWGDLRKLIKAMAWIESRYTPTDEELDEARPTPNLPNLPTVANRSVSIGRLPVREGRADALERRPS